MKIKFIIFYDTYYTELTFDPEGFEIWEFQKIVLEKLHLDRDRVICLIHDRGVLGRDIPFEESLYKLSYHPVVYVLINHFPKIEDIPFRDNHELFIDFLEDEDEENICDTYHQADRRDTHIESDDKCFEEPDEVYEKNEQERYPVFRTGQKRQSKKKKITRNISISDSNSSSSDNDSGEEENRRSERIIKKLDKSYPNVESSGINLAENRQERERRTTSQVNGSNLGQISNPMASIMSQFMNSVPITGSSSSIYLQMYGGGNRQGTNISAQGDNLLQSIMGLMTALGGLGDGPSVDSFLDILDNLEDVPVTLDMEAVNKLPVFKFKECRDKMEKLPEDQHSKCTICLEEFDNEDEVRMLFCKHVFHKDCVDKWLIERNVTCPLCRSDTRE